MSEHLPGTRVLIVIPCLNEEAHLPHLLETLCADPGAETARIVVADGGSSDSSVSIVEAFARRDARVALLHNPKRIQSAAVNLAVATFGEPSLYLIRIDAHAIYPADYVAQLIAACEEWRADAVTVVMRAEAPDGGWFQRANAAAQNSVLGAGGSAHRNAGARRWVDHGHHALFRRDVFIDAGGYDESFSHNEDAELDARILALDGRILLAGDITIGYIPRASARSLYRQYYNFGRGRARMLLLHRAKPKLRQMAPLAVAPAAFLALLAPFAPPLSLMAAAPFAAWLVLCFTGGLVLGARKRDGFAALAGAPAAIIHFAWSMGFWSALVAQLMGSGAARARPLKTHAS